MAYSSAASEPSRHEPPEMRRTLDRLVDDLRRTYPPDAVEAWLAACRTLSDAGLGNACLIAYLRAGPTCARLLGPETAQWLGRSTTVIGRRAGGAAALALLWAAPAAARLLVEAPRLHAWLEIVEELAERAPESVAVALDRTEGLLARLSLDDCRAWMLGGVRAAGGDPEARLRFFSFADPRAEQWLEREAGEIELSRIESRLKAYYTALWGSFCRLRRPVRAEGRRPPRRASFDGTIIRLPEAFKGISGRDAADLYRAAVMHIGAHLAYSGERFPVGSLKPLQVALVSIVEDARVEQLAMRRFPGLRQLWLPFHVARPTGAAIAPTLMARLARALVDPRYEDENAWVGKGRRLFFEQEERWDDPALSREIGGLLGNDLGQMRVQFNVRTYEVEPPYRDDNHGLWDYGDDDRQSLDMETIYEAVRVERAPESPETPSKPLAGEVPPDDAAVPIASYPEWDYLIGRERPEWATVVDYPLRPGGQSVVERILEDNPVLVNRITSVIRSAKVSRPVRLRRQAEGDRLDFDACIEAAITRRRRETPDHRVYMTMTRRHRDMAVLVLLDVSESTNDRVRGSFRRVVSLERDATAMLAHAMDELGDNFAVRAFCSNGREEVRYFRVKDFGEPYQDAAKRRLGGLKGGFSTRMGAALRQAGAELAGQFNHRKLLLIITDGEPSDIDVPDRRYLVEDARKAVISLTHLGVDVFCVGLDSGGDRYLHQIFGRTNTVSIDRLDRLAEHLMAIYFRLTK